MRSTRNCSRSITTLARAMLVTTALAAVVPSSLMAIPVMTFGAPAGLTVSQLSVGGEALLFAVCQEPYDWTSRLVFHLAAVVDTNQDGQIEYSVGEPLARRAVWVAADVATGSLEVSNPTSNPPNVLTVDPTPMIATAGKLEDVRQGLRLLVLRPGGGAWHGTATDGGAGDAGPADDGRVLLELATLTKVATSSTATGVGLSNLLPGDLVVGVDTTTLATYHFTVPAANTGRR